VIYDLPVVFDFDAASAGSNFPYRWDPEYHARVGLLPREGSARDVVWFDVEPCYVFHPLNAYDDGDRVVLDVVRHQRMFATEFLGPDEGAPTLDRWTLDLTAEKLLEDRLDDHAQELPRVDERVVGRRHRFGYALLISGGAGEPSGIIKHDFDAGTNEVRAPAGQHAGEAVFVPRTPDAAEDDGWVLSLVYDAHRDASDLVVVNAADFTGEPQAVVHLPQRVPYGFHGNWVPDPS
jgi:carotenoid cleavage dioxygenase